VDNAVEAFIRALSAKDVNAVRSTLAPEVRFRGLTPNDEWEAHSPDEAATILFGSWFEEPDKITDLVSYDVRDVSGRVSFRYCFRVQNPDGKFIVEQQGYASLTDDGRIGDMSVVCSGFRAVAPQA
jgi:hypothetical protein